MASPVVNRCLSARESVFDGSIHDDNRHEVVRGHPKAMAAYALELTIPVDIPGSEGPSIPGAAIRKRFG